MLIITHHEESWLLVSVIIVTIYIASSFVYLFILHVYIHMYQLSQGHVQDFELAMPNAWGDCNGTMLEADSGDK